MKNQVHLDLKKYNFSLIPTLNFSAPLLRQKLKKDPISGPL